MAALVLYIRKSGGKIYMITIKINDKEYNLKYGHRVLVENSLLSKIFKAQSGTLNGISDGEDFLDRFVGNFEKQAGLTVELLLAGLQRDYEEFRYDPENEIDKKDKYNKAADLLDDYSDCGGDIIALFEMINGELEKKGFMADVSRRVNEVGKMLQEELKKLEAQEKSKAKTSAQKK